MQWIQLSVPDLQKRREPLKTRQAGRQPGAKGALWQDRVDFITDSCDFLTPIHATPFRFCFRFVHYPR